MLGSLSGGAGLGLQWVWVGAGLGQVCDGFGLGKVFGWDCAWVGGCDAGSGH